MIDIREGKSFEQRIEQIEDFIYKNKDFHLSLDTELENYEMHDNSFQSEGYVKIFVDLINGYVKPLNITVHNSS